MDDSQYSWTVVYTTILGFATLATISTLLMSFQQIKVGQSAVQFIAYSMCWANFIYSAARFVFYSAVLFNFYNVRVLLDDVENGQLVGVRVIYSDARHSKTVVVIIALTGDLALLCTTFWVMTIAFELTRLIRKSMDRGVERERRTIRRYCLVTYGSSTLFALVMLSSALFSPNQEAVVQEVAFSIQLACVWLSFVYPLYCTLRISVRKRLPRARVDPASEVLHQRVKNLVRVYCVLVFPSCLIELLLRTVDGVPVVWVGISQALYYMSGGATAIVIGASVSCCYRTLRPIMPVTVYEQLLENGYFSETMRLEKDCAVEPPLHFPVFVYTDIQGSTELWANAPQEMDEAQSLHDDLLRRELLRFNGYEITTVGDAFQLAFHEISDAIGWCLRVQQKLLKVQWPSGLLQHQNAVRVHDIWGKLIFNGLRVRMAIHDSDNSLICSIHPTTGKMTYMGMSEMVTREMSELGKGGQIIISDSALLRFQQEARSDDERIVALQAKFRHQRFEKLERPELGISVEVHELLVEKLGDRIRKETQTRRDVLHARVMLAIQAHGRQIGRIVE